MIQEPKTGEELERLIVEHPVRMCLRMRLGLMEEINDNGEDMLDAMKMTFDGLVYSMFRPPKPQTVSEWADENRVLTSESASEPGPWRTDRAPYQREIMDAFTQPGV